MKKTYLRLTTALPESKVGFSWQPAVLESVLEDATQEFYFPRVGAVTKRSFGIRESLSAGLVITKSEPRKIHLFTLPAGVDVSGLDEFRWKLIQRSAPPLIYLSDVTEIFRPLLIPASKEDWEREKK